MGPNRQKNGNHFDPPLSTVPAVLPEKSVKNYTDVRYFLLVAIVAALYFGTAKLGLSLAVIHANVSPVWPPTGVAIAAVLILGYRVWPGILLGAFFANLFTPVSIATAGGIAIGNTLEALAAGLILNSLDFHTAFDRAKDVFKFVVVTILCTTVSATIGTLSLCLSQAAPWEGFGNLWLTWWLGNTIGGLLVAPLLLTWASGSHWLPKKRYLEGLVVLFLLAVAAMVTFGGPPPIPIRHYPIARLTIPFLLWAALRLGQRGLTLATLTISGFAVWGTAQGLGPFVGRTPNESLLLLQVFLGSNAVTFLFLVAAVEERRLSGELLRENERRLAGKFAITRIIAESPSLADASSRILQTIGETFRWQVGNMWVVRRDANVLTCLTVWHAASITVDRFEAVSKSEQFAPGVGLPGLVWTSSKPFWIRDVASAGNFLRAQIAVGEGLHAAVAFPILSEGRVLGVMEFFSDEIRERDDALMEMLTSIGSQLGQFMDRKQAEQALSQREEQLRLAVAAANMGAWEYDLPTARVKWSSGLEAIHGLEPSSFGGTFEDYQKDIHPEDHQRVMEAFARTIEHGDEHNIEYRIIRPDGSIRWVEEKGQLIRDSSGNATRITGVCMDISQRKRAEEEREHLLTREHEARAAAELANQTKDEFLAIVSHELRTPLNAIVGWAGMLRSGKLADNQVSQAIEIIDRNAKVQAQLIEDILDVARIVSGKPRLDLRPVNLQQVVQSAVDSTQPAADEKNISLQLGIDSKAKPVLGDSARLEQIVWNLLTNSVKFTPAGGHINVDLISADSEVRIVVRDTGQGIAPEFLPHVFDRFRQADTSSTRRQGGLGLGLAIVHQLVELHGGTVEAFSAGEGKGATFTVEFPCIGSGSEISLDEGNLTEVMPSGQVASPGR